MSEQNQAQLNEDDFNGNANMSFCTFCDGNGKELMNELKWKMATLEVTKNLNFIEKINPNIKAKNQLFEATNKHLEEKLKHFEEKQVQEKKYSELEAKMLMQKMEHLEADWNKKLVVLEKQQKGNSDLVTEGNANDAQAILEKLKDAMGKAEENIQKNQQKIEDLSKEVANLKIQNQKLAEEKNGFGEKLEEAEQKAQLAKNKVNLMM
jgi:DNA repair exonuclease SbcCD ATPase subunit